MERLSPSGPMVREPHPEETIEAPELGSLRSAAEQSKLLPERFGDHSRVEMTGVGGKDLIPEPDGPKLALALLNVLHASPNGKSLTRGSCAPLSSGQSLTLGTPIGAFRGGEQSFADARANGKVAPLPDPLARAITAEFGP